MNDTDDSKKTGRPRKIGSRQGEYSKLQKHADKIRNKLFELLESTNENIALGAAKVLYNKIVPDLKAMEIKTEERGLTINLITKPDGDRLSQTSQPTTKTA